jgi:hypothetical protein
MRLVRLQVNLISPAGLDVKYNVIELVALHKVLKLRPVETPGDLMQMLV